MSRVFKIDSPGKIRNQLMRTSAELLRHLGEKSRLDEEARDMASLLVYCLRQVDVGVDESALAWEKRNYWVKAEQFRARWAWAGECASELDGIVRAGAWDRLPAVLIKLLPYFEDIKVVKFTRSPGLWCGAYERLLQEPPDPKA
jgi:hypothetical protein